MYGGKASEVICQVLNKTSTLIAAAELLGVRKQALYEWMKKYQIRREIQYVSGQKI
jgi:transcriptional regulator with PAS, ATPase and Fis domain